MRVTIIDLDWYAGKSKVANPLCQKLSSYYRQLGGLINFALDEWQAKMAADLIYIVREDSSSLVPAVISVQDERVRLLGDSFRFFKQYQRDIPEEAKGCRPDYNLYPITISEEGKMERPINNLQFFSKGRILAKMQNAKQATNRAATNLIVDKGVWRNSVEDLKVMVHRLRRTTNIAYKHPIDLSDIVGDAEKVRLFSELRYERGTVIPLNWNADIGRTAEFVLTFKEHQKNLAVLIPELKIVSCEDDNGFFSEYSRVLSAISLGKRMKVRMHFIAPQRDECPLYYEYFEDLEAWRYAHQSSYIEFMTNVIAKTKEYRTEETLYGDKWYSKRVQNFKTILNEIPTVIDTYGYCQWGDKRFHKRIEFDKIF